MKNDCYRMIQRRTNVFIRPIKAIRTSVQTSQIHRNY